MSASDATLWQRWQAHRDPDAFAEIVARHSAMVFGVCKRILVSAAEAEDAAQESFLELLNGQVAVENSLAPWLHTVAVRRAINRRKSESRRRAREARFALAKAQVAKVPGAEVALNDLAGEIDVAIAALPEELRAVVICRYLEGNTYEQIAQRLGAPESTVRYRANKGVEAIRAHLEHRGIPVGVEALSACLSMHMLESASTKLTAILGKLAIGGATGAVVTQTGGGVTGAAALSTIGGILAMKKAAIGAIALIAILAGLWAITHPSAKQATPTAKPVKIPSVVQAKLDDMQAPAGKTTKEVRPTLVENPTERAAGAEDFNASPAAKSPEAGGPASVAGCVTDMDGQPIEGVEIKLSVGQRTQIVDNVSYMNVEGQYPTTTRADGTYEITGITTFGTLELTASAPGYVTEQSGWGRHVPGSPPLKEIERGGEYRGVNFKLMQAASRLAGRVLDQARTPIPDARVVLAKQLGEKESQGWYFAVSDAAGHFELALPCEGTCVLNVRKAGYGTGHFPDIASGTEDLELVLEGGGAIEGRAADTSDTPLAGLNVIVMAEQAPGDIGNPWMATGWITTVTDKEGHYRLDDLSPSFTYTVRLPFPRPGESEKQEGVRTLREAIKFQQFIAYSVDEFRYGIFPSVVLDEKASVEVRPGEVTRVDLVAEKKAITPAVVYGRVTDPNTGAAVCPLYVSAFSSALDPPVLGIAATEPDGTYRIEIRGLTADTPAAIKAGYCYAPRQLGNGLYRNVEAQPDITALTLMPGQEYEVNFTIEASVTAPVRCVTTEGQPTQGVEVHGLRPDPEGRLMLYGLAPYMTHQLVAETKTPEHAWIPRGTSAPFSGKPGETLDEIEIVCHFDSGAFSGHVVVPEGMDEIPISSILCEIYYVDGRHQYLAPSIAPQGAFRVQEALPGKCSILLSVPSEVPEEQWWALVENVEILANQNTDLGAIVPNPPEVNPPAPTDGAATEGAPTGENAKQGASS